MEARRIKLDQPNIKCPLFSITLANGRAKLDITNIAAIPSDYVEVEVVEKVDKKKLLEELKAGVAIPGCCLSQTEQSIRIS